MMRDLKSNGAADRMLTVPEAAERLGLSVATIRSWVARRRLGTVPICSPSRR